MGSRIPQGHWHSHCLGSVSISTSGRKWGFKTQNKFIFRYTCNVTITISLTKELQICTTETKIKGLKESQIIQAPYRKGIAVPSLWNLGPHTGPWFAVNLFRRKKKTATRCKICFYTYGKVGKNIFISIKSSLFLNVVNLYLTLNFWHLFHNLKHVLPWIYQRNNDRPLSLLWKAKRLPRGWSPIPSQQRILLWGEDSDLTMNLSSGLKIGFWNFEALVERVKTSKNCWQRFSVIMKQCTDVFITQKVNQGFYFRMKNKTKQLSQVKILLRSEAVITEQNFIKR